jgi:hypothetical protein
MLRLMWFLVAFGALFTGCWFAYEKTLATENVQLKADLAATNQAHAASVEASNRAATAFAVKQEEQKKALKVLFPDKADAIEKVFAPPAPAAAQAAPAQAEAQPKKEGEAK